MTLQHRPLTPDETYALRRNGSGAEKRGLLAAYAFGSLFLFMALSTAILALWNPVAAILALPERDEVKWWLVLASAVIVVLFVRPSFLRNYRYARTPGSYGEKVDADVAGGLASVEILEVDEVYEIEEFEDEGAGFLFSLADGRVLCLIGQDLYPYSAKADPDEKDFTDTVFPSTLIEHTYAPNSGFVFGTRGLGGYLKPKAILQWPDRGPAFDEASGLMPDSFMDGPADAIMTRAGLVKVQR